MQKDWFIFEVDHHIGPFSAEEVLKMHGEGRISDKTMLWKEGHKEWLPFAMLFNDPAPNELPPPPPMEELPPEPLVEEQPDFSADRSSLNQLMGEEQEMPPLPVESQAETQAESADVFDPDDLHGSIVEKQDRTGEVVVSSLSPSKWVKVFFITISVMVAVLGLYFLLVSPSGDIKPGNISKNDLERLNNIVESDHASLKVDFALTQDGTHLWMGSNISGPAQIELKLESIPDKVLASEKIVLMTKGELSGYYAQFGSFQIVEGKGLVPGLYQIRLSGVFTGLKSKLMGFAKTFKFLHFVSAIENYSEQFKMQGKFLLISSDEKHFYDLLDRFLGEKKEREQGPVREMLERYRTFSSLLKKLELIYKNNIRKFSQGAQVASAFQKEYSKELSPLFEMVVLGDGKVQVLSIDQDELVVRMQEQLGSFVKSFGSIVSDMVTKTKELKRLSQRNKTHLIGDFEKRIEALEQRAVDNIEQLQKRLL